MKKTIFAALILISAAFVGGCATADFQPYEGKNNFYEGNGGTKMVVDGVEFWANGTPPRKYSILGMVTSEIGSGYMSESLIRSAVVEEVQKRGGNAAIQVDDESGFAGIIKTAPGMYMTAGRRKMRFSAIKYVE